jgi:hypothetical protein
VADTIVAEIRAFLADLETDEGRNSVRYPVLDADAGYARWAEVYDELENPVISHENQVVRELLAGRRVLSPGGWLLTTTMHPWMRTICGWSAWFDDAGGRADVEPTDSARPTTSTPRPMSVSCCVEP